MRSFLLLAGLALGGCLDSYRITITQMQIHNDADNSGTPEIEVYLFDNDDDLIACAGSRQGLQYVDTANIVYELDATLINDDNDTSIGLGGGALRFEVWEDDDDPVCPRYPDPQGNDVIGVGPAMPLSKWVSFEEELVFGDVSGFVVVFD